MMGQQSREESLFYSFRLEDQIPETHLLRLIDRYVDFTFVRDRLKSFYSQTGRPSIDPETLLRLLPRFRGNARTEIGDQSETIDHRHRARADHQEQKR